MVATPLLYTTQVLQKHWAFLRQGALVALEYRTETLLWIIIDFIPFIALAFVWQAIFASNPTISGYTLGMVLQHYLLVTVIQRISECHFEQFRSQEIRDGKIDFFLIRPYAYVQQILTSEISTKTLSAIWFLPALFAFSWFISTFETQAATVTANAMTILMFIGVVVAAYAIQFCLSLIIVFLTFWFEGSSGLEHFKWASVAVLGGGIMPYDLMPKWLQGIIAHLPFRYLYATPIRIMLGTYQMQQADWINLAVSVGALVVLTKMLWVQGRKKYASAGG